MRTELDIVGRDEELDQLLAFVRDSTSGVLVLEGEAGIGKTTLWRAAVAEAQSVGLVVTASPARAEEELAFAGLTDLLDPVLDDVRPDLPEPQRRALDVALLHEDSTGPSPDPRAIAAALLSALRVLARRRRVVVAVDDLQWLDSPSAAALEFAARRLGEDDVALLLARRLEPGGSLPLELERLDPVKLRVEPISLGALQRLLRTRLATVFPRSVVRRIHETTGGNPLFALEVGRLLEDRAADLEPGEPLPVPPTLSEVIELRLSSLPEETLSALRAASALARPTVPLLEALAERKDVLAPALRERIIEAVGAEVRFTHPLLASRLYAQLTGEERARLHRRLAQLVEDPGEHARHLALGTVEPDADVAETLAQYAGDLLSRGAPATAAELYEHAARLAETGGSTAWAAHLVSAADAWAMAGDRARATALAERAVERLPPGLERATALLRKAERDRDEAGVTRALALCDQAIEESEGDLRVRIEALLKQSELRHLAGDYEGVRASTAHALELAEELDDSALLVVALTKAGNAETVLGVGEPDARFRRALELERDAAVGTFWGRFYWSPATTLAVLLMRRGELDEARELLARQDRRALDAGDEDSRAHLSIHLAEVECMTGRLAAARAYADMGYAACQLIGSDHLLGATCYARALVATFAGDVEDARAVAAEGLDLLERIGDRTYRSHVRNTLCFLEHSLGRDREALEQRADVQIDEPIEGRGRISYTGEEIEALLAVGEMERAEELTSALEERAGELDRRPLVAIAERCRGLIRAAQGDLEGAIATIEHAREQWEGLPMPLERGRTLLVLGVVHRRAKHKRAAREAFETARELFEQIGARLWAEKARDELARISGRTRTEGLTPTEERIASLVANGRSNKEVAAELFVTVKTVERNLSRIYEKLGIRSRAELARDLAPR